MSGGSFDYLCWKSIGEALDSEQLDAMAGALEAFEMPGAREAAAQTVALLRMRARLAKRITTLRDVWYAVEWERSGDHGEEQVREALGEYLRAEGLDLEGVA